jgi:hypothetical protein
MKREILVRAEARIDLLETKEYYDKISDDITTRFFSEFLETLSFIKSEPKLYQIRYRDIRIAPMHQFPFGIHYIEKGDQVIVLRVLHTKRYFK